MPKPLKKSIFIFFAELLEKHQKPPVLIGGYALIANKVQRMTFDVNIMVTKENLEGIENDLIAVGYEVCNRQDVFLQL